jgi:hypothetical protein
VITRTVPAVSRRLSADPLDNGFDFRDEAIGQYSASRAAYQSRASSSSARAAGLKTTDGTLSAVAGARP